MSSGRLSCCRLAGTGYRPLDRVLVGSPAAETYEMKTFRKVEDIDRQRQLNEHLKLQSIDLPEFAAENHAEEADSVLANHSRIRTDPI